MLDCVVSAAHSAMKSTHHQMLGAVPCRGGGSCRKRAGQQHLCTAQQGKTVDSTAAVACRTPLFSGAYARTAPLATAELPVVVLFAGTLPKCFAGTSRVPSIAGTYLTSTAPGLGSQAGGACDPSPPDCDADVGCV